MTSIGIDIIEIERVESAINQWQERFLHRIYTGNELILCRGRASSLASRFAAKEAVMKVLGTGTKGISWKHIEILNDSQGKPVIKLHGNAEIKARELKLKEFSISLSDSKQCAVATAIGV